MYTLPVYNIEGKEVEQLKLDGKVFDGVINEACLYQAIESYRANQRKGLASTKTRGEVSGGGKKPWKQKGTGRARVGSTRSPLWKHGGVVFGPHPRDFSYEIPAKIKSLALKSTLNAKLKENNFIILDDFILADAKTKSAAKVFADLKLVSKKIKKNPKVIFLTHLLSKNSKIGLKNLSSVKVDLAKDTHAYEIMNSQKVVITKQGLIELTERLNK